MTLFLLLVIWFLLLRLNAARRRARTHSVDSLTITEITARIETGEIKVGELARWTEVAAAAQKVAVGA